MPLLFPDTQVLEIVDEDIDEQVPAKLIVWNDDINSFDWVIESLVSVCNHTQEQAAQCAWIIHTKGKYAVKSGALSEMRPMREALVERGLQATVEY